MRVKFGNKIYLCTKVSCLKESKLLLITTSNGVYTVNMIANELAEQAFNNLLINGYCDVSKYEYSN